MKRPFSLLMAILICFGVFSKMGTAAFAAGERMTTYMVGLPLASNSNKAGWGGHSALEFMGG